MALTNKYSLVTTTLQPVKDHPQASRAVCFDIAALAIPAGRVGAPNYVDDGERFEFRLVDGKVIEAASDAPFTTVFESDEETKGAKPLHEPRFSMIAASGGRVFAKEAGKFSFWFATLQDADTFFDPERASWQRVRNAHFSFDPDHDRDPERSEELVQAMRANYGKHPASERYRLLAELLEGASGLGFQVVFTEPGQWHWLDTRPAIRSFDFSNDPRDSWWSRLVKLTTQVGAVASFLAEVLGGKTGTGLPSVNLKHLGSTARNLLEAGNVAAQEGELVPGKRFKSAMLAHFSRKDGKPRHVKTFELAVSEVLGIGVGHVHMHEQYEPRYGGELMPLHQASPFAQTEPLYALSYRFFNGPIQDADGFIDGTCNFYVFCKLQREGGLPDAYAILWTDEQTFFSQRWRLLHPTDDVEGLQFALCVDIAKQPDLYRFKSTAWWSPLEDGHVSDESRMAVARQVILVTGKMPDGTPELYSINFSWASCDRTWRWRRYPAPAIEGEPRAVDDRDCVFPRSVRLREDMTIVLQGKRDGRDGYWFQKYLPADNRPIPFIVERPTMTSARPKEGFTHAWDFLPTEAFEKADRRLHFGVYEEINSRCQYYKVELSPEDLAEVKAAGPDAVWSATPEDLYVNTARFNWHANVSDGVLKGDDLLIKAPGKDWIPTPPGLYGHELGPGARFKLLDRGDLGVIAVYADKRDDSMLPLSDLPKQVTLRSAGKRISVTVVKNEPVKTLPEVQRTEAKLGDGIAHLLVETRLPRIDQFTQLWQVRIGSASNPDLLTANWSEFKEIEPGKYAYSWEVHDPAIAALLSRSGRESDATNVWFKDVVGHVAVPEAQQFIWTQKAIT